MIYEGTIKGGKTIEKVFKRNTIIIPAFVCDVWCNNFGAGANWS
jgi:hypothetical protein